MWNMEGKESSFTIVYIRKDHKFQGKGFVPNINAVENHWRSLMRIGMIIVEKTIKINIKNVNRGQVGGLMDWKSVLEMGGPGFKFDLRYFLAVWLWASDLTPIT